MSPGWIGDQPIQTAQTQTCTHAMTTETTVLTGDAAIRMRWTALLLRKREVPAQTSARRFLSVPSNQATPNSFHIPSNSLEHSVHTGLYSELLLLLVGY
jgi:hypothetical protein